MQHIVKVLVKACKHWGMHISVEKILAVGEQEPDHPPIQGQALEEVESHT